MGVDTLTVRGIYTSRHLALKAAANWYGITIGYLPIEEGKGKDKVPVTSLLDPDDVALLLGKVQYEPQTKEYVLWVYPRCPTFRHIEAGDLVEIASKGWGYAMIPNLEMELWVCTHGIAGGANVKSIKKCRSNYD